jgi:hypothetical protein
MKLRTKLLASVSAIALATVPLAACGDRVDDANQTAVEANQEANVAAAHAEAASADANAAQADENNE